MKFNLFKKFNLILVAAMSCLSFSTGYSQERGRTEVAIPNIPGYFTLKCDFHMHTVFSDGSVWPTTRVEEAWLEGLDAISITDHLEYQPHKNDVKKDLKRPYEIAKSKADELDIILIKGVEITKSMPPGHFNAIFVTDENAIENEDWRKSIQIANDQGAFVFWNHPGWKAQAPDGAKWWPEHTELFDKGLFQGIEVVNWYDYYPTVFQWALDKNLTMFGNSDVHPPTGLGFDLAGGAHRPMTLVFSKEKSRDAIRNALDNKRTAVYYENLLIGAEEFLKPIFEESVTLLNPKVKIVGKGRAYVQIHNSSQVCFELEKAGDVSGLSVPENIKLHPNKTMLFKIQNKVEGKTGSQKIKIPYDVKNMLVTPDQGLPVELNVEVEFI